MKPQRIKIFLCVTVFKNHICGLGQDEDFVQDFQCVSLYFSDKSQ